MKLSIITVNYNDAKGLERTILSVISQTKHNFEFIVIDGGSTDGSIDVIKKYEGNINYWVSEPDGGIYQGMNKGLRQAKGDYVNFMNSGATQMQTSSQERMSEAPTLMSEKTGSHYTLFVLVPLIIRHHSSNVTWPYAILMMRNTRL